MDISEIMASRQRTTPTGLSAPDTKAGRTQRVVLDLLNQKEQAGDLPTNARFVFYELEQVGNATKPDPADTRRNRRRSHGWPPGSQDVGDALEHLREAGIVPWDWLVDETRTLTDWSHAATVRDYLRDRLAEATLNPWGAQQEPPLIICESKATAGVLRAAVSPYVCPITGIGGQCGGFLRTEVAPLLRGRRRVLYLGDLDRSGEDIERNARDILASGTGWVGGWERLAMTEAVRKAHGIEPIWKVDGRDGAGHWATEVESLGQRQLVTLVRSRLDALLPEPLGHVQERAGTERVALDRYLDAFPGADR
jgi:hypothetical protein